MKHDGSSDWDESSAGGSKPGWCLWVELYEGQGGLKKRHIRKYGQMCGVCMCLAYAFVCMREKLGVTDSGCNLN